MSCRKKSYETWQHARNDATTVGRKHRRSNEHASVYMCRHCQKWHVGGSWDGLDYRPKGKRRPRVAVDGD